METAESKVDKCKALVIIPMPIVTKANKANLEKTNLELDLITK